MYELLKKAGHGDRESLDILTRKNSGLVYSVASRFEGRGYDSEDLQQIGMIGLIKAIRRFDASYDVKFSTYAVPLIAGEIRRFLRDDGIIKVSRRYKELVTAANQASRELSTLLLREPTIGEIAEKLGVDTYILTEALNSANPCDSLDRSVSEDGKGDLLLLDTISEDKPFSEDDRIALNCALSHLGSRERTVIAYRYFMDETQVTVAKRLGISQVQVSRIEKKALTLLKEILYNGETH